MGELPEILPACVPNSRPCLPRSVEITLHVGACEPAERWYFLDKMLRAPRAPLNIAAVAESEETSVNVVSGVRGSPGEAVDAWATTRTDRPRGGRSSWGRPAGCASHASPFHVRCFRKGNRKGE